MSSPTDAPRRGFTGKEWLIIVVAIIGFFFDIYELLMLPLIQQAALAELLKVPPGHPSIREWFVTINAAAAISGGLFGLLGGYLIDRFGRKKIMVASILIYGVSPVLAAFSVTPMQLLIFRCTTFIGVCVQFVAAVAWLAELFPDKKRRETVLGFTQAFSSFGGLAVTSVFALLTSIKNDLPALPLPEGFNQHADWRYTLISGLIPAIPILLLLPFLPESPIWLERKAAGTLRRPSVSALFSPELRRTTILCTILFACAYGAAFGAIQLTPGQIAPGIPELKENQKAMAPIRAEQKKELAKFDAARAEDDEEGMKTVRKRLAELKKSSEENQDAITRVTQKTQFSQEMGGLIGRLVFAGLALVIASRVNQLRFFVIPGLFLVPLYFWYGALHSADFLLWGIAIAAFCTVSQYSFWGNYLPAAYPVHLRGTAGGFTANIGGRMIGGSMGLLTSFVVIDMFLKPKGGAAPGMDSTYTAQGAAIVGGLMFLIAAICTFLLPEPKKEEET